MISLTTSARGWLGANVTRFPPGERTLVSVLRWRAEQMPQAPWLAFDGGTPLTFGEAWHHSRAIAIRLRADFGEHPKIGIALRNRVEFVLALYGTLLAGGTAFLIDSAWPFGLTQAALRGERLDATIRAENDDMNSDVSLYVDGRPSRALIPVADPAVESDAVPQFDEGQDAIVMFTSGTTGTPKGVVCSHGYAYHYSALVTDSLKRGQNDVLSTALPMVHSGGLHMVANSALHAGCVGHIKSRFSVSRFWRDVVVDGATQVNLVAEMARMLTARSEPAGPHRLRYVIAGGLFDHADFEHRFGVAVLWQAYGMTEVYPIPMTTRTWGKARTTLGLPLSCYEYGVVDEEGAPLPADSVGELVLRPTAPSVAFSRYLNDQDATRRAWRDGIFHTGDLAQLDESGVVSFAGRIAGRVRRRGNTVDTSEVDTVARDFAGVRESVAYAVPGDAGDDEIKLDVTGDGPIDLQGLYQYLSERLRPQALPRYLEHRNELPRTLSFRVALATLRAEPLQRPGVFDATTHVTNGEEDF